MLKGTNYWDSGYMNLYLNNKPTKVYVPPEDPERVYELSQRLLANEGTIPIGIDHLPEEVIKSNPILQKLDLLHVGDITAVEFNKDTKSVQILEAEFTNPLLQKLYDNGELESVSIVSEVSTKPCPRNNSIPVIETKAVERVDIVGVGACDSCRIPIKSDKTMVYARKPIKGGNNMSEEKFTKEDMEELLNKQLEEFNNQIKELKDSYDEKIKGIEDKIENTEVPIEPATGSENAEITAMKAEIEALKKQNAETEAKMKVEAANALVDGAINQGKIYPSQKEAYVKLAASDSEAFTEMMKNAPEIVPINQRQSLNAGSADDNGSAPELSALDLVKAHFKKGDD